MEWARVMERKWPELRLLHSIPNGGHRHIAVARKLQAEGCKPGVPDLCWPYPSGGYHGMYIEMKTAAGRLTEAQREWIRALNGQGYHAIVARGAKEAIEAIENYLAGECVPERASGA